MRWQHAARALLAVAAIGFGVVIVRDWRRRPEVVESAPTKRSDPTATTESTGATATRFKGGAQDYELSYRRRRTYDNGLTKFDGDVKVDVRGRGGRDFLLNAQEADVSDDQSRIEVRRDVTLTSSSGFVAHTDQATYTSADAFVRAPGRVDFDSGKVSGQGIGATFDQNHDVVWLLDQAVVRIAPEGGEPTEIHSGTAGFARRDRYLRFERGSRITRGAEVIESDTAVVYLNDVEDRIELIELRGNSRVGYAQAVAGGLENLTATDMNLDYRDDGRTLEKATLVGDSRLKLGGADPGSSRTLSARLLDLGVAGDGATVTSIAAREGVTLDLVETGQPTRRIRSRVMDGRGTDEAGITEATFSDGADFRETKPAAGATAAVDRTVRSERLDVGVARGFGALQRAVFTGRAQIRDQGLQASAPQAQYNVTTGHLSLVGGGAAGATGGRALVDDEEARVEAAQVDVELGDHSLSAKTDIRSELKNRGEAGNASPRAKRPAMLDAKSPVSVTGDELVYDRTAQKATYTGNARLWQADTYVVGDVIVLDEATGNLTSTGNVRSQMPLEQKNAKTGQVERQNSLATAKNMVHDDARHMTTYTTTARFIGPQGDVKGDKIELFLSSEGKSLERAEAYGSVLLRSQARWATGSRLTYFAADERYVMVGTPVRILEQAGPDCRETLGKTLTFFRSVDTILVDGNQDSRTQSKSGGKCPEPPQD